MEKKKVSLTFHEKLGRCVVLTRGGGFVWWSRVVYQNFVLGGEPIPKGVIVHHKDKNSTNDTPENLEGTTRGQHPPIHRTGTQHSEETKRKIGKGNKGKERTLELKQKLSEVHTGVPLSAEHSKKISEGLSGKSKSPEHVEKVRQANLGKKRSPETRAKISESKAGKPGVSHSPETKARISEARKEYWRNKKEQQAL